jgi:outer membrane immunogenic protein
MVKIRSSAGQGSKLKAYMSVRIAAVVFFATCTGQVALAGGIEVPPTFYDWTGVYVGANAGYASGSVSDAVNGTQSFSGAIAGGQIGANLQYRNTLFGVEVDGDWSNQQGSGTSLSASMPWLATARIRVGYAYDNIAYYATGGAGYAQFKSSAINGAVSSSARTAWVAGGGQESAINRNLLLRFEILYLQLLGNPATAGAAAVSSSQSVYDIIFRAGLSYKFDWPGN